MRLLVQSHFYLCCNKLTCQHQHHAIFYDGQRIYLNRGGSQVGQHLRHCLFLFHNGRVA
jgi:hypothetical protein